METPSYTNQLQSQTDNKCEPLCLYLYLYFVFVFVFETNLNYICSDAYQRVHKISHKAKIEKKSFVDSYLEGFIGQTRHVCLRETAATAVRECKEF